MGRLVFLAIIGLVIYLVLRGLRRRSGEDTEQRGVAGIEDMVRCARCGVHLPRGESVMSRGRFYCGDEHRRLDQS